MIVLDSFGHLYTTDDIYELVHFATEKLKLHLEWNHCSRWFPHWDLTTTTMRSKGYALGAHKPSGHAENASLIKEAEDYAKGLLATQQWTSVLYLDKGLYGQRIHRVDYPKLFEILGE